MFKQGIWNSRDFISLRSLLWQTWKSTQCTQNEKNIALVSWSVWHLPLLTFVFCRSSLTAGANWNPSCFAWHQVQMIGQIQQDARCLWGCLCEKMCKSSTIIHNVCMLRVEKTMSINIKYVCCCFVMCTHLHMCMMRPKPLKHPCRRCVEKWVVTLVPDLEQWGLFLYTHHHWHVPAYLTSCHLQHCSFCAAEQWQMVRTKLFV